MSIAFMYGGVWLENADHTENWDFESTGPFDGVVSVPMNICLNNPDNEAKNTLYAIASFE